MTSSGRLAMNGIGRDVDKTFLVYTLISRNSAALVLLLLLGIHYVSQNCMFLINISHGCYCNKAAFKVSHVLRNYIYLLRYPEDSALYYGNIK